MEIMLLIFSAAKLLQYSLINNVSFILKKLHYTNYFLELNNGEFNLNNVYTLKEIYPRDKVLDKKVISHDPYTDHIAILKKKHVQVSEV